MQNEQLHDCIKACWNCRHECQKTLFDHCLKVEGAHVEQAHVKFMIDCVDICQVAADFMTRGSELYEYVCGTCAVVCEACAESCEQIGNEEMLHCAEACRKCAKSCCEISEV